MQQSRLTSYTLVAIQFACLLAIALTGPLVARNPLLLALEAAAVLLGVWALLAVRIDKLNVTPDPRPDAELVRHGPYRWIRHPMYAALLLGTLALVLDASTPVRWGLWLVLLIDLLVKLHYEERLLMEHFEGYRVYMAASKRLVPLLY
jgi:protein-S-isoprenylcysteine O-methyltransferase Ste14